MFDLKKDPLESKNLIKPHSNRLDFNNLSPSNIRENVNLDSSIVSNKCMEANNHTTCSTRYYENNIRKIIYIMSKLKNFVHYGNAGHQYYMRHYEKQAVCHVPVVSEIHPLRYGEPNCTSCSYPEY